MGAQAKLQQAGQQIEEMQKAMQQMQQQMQQKPPEPTSALDQARIQDMVAKAMREERKLALEEAKAGPQMGQGPCAGNCHNDQCDEAEHTTGSASQISFPARVKHRRRVIFGRIRPPLFGRGATNYE